MFISKKKGVRSMTTLNKSQVVFSELDHTYTLDGKSLSGVTSILNRQLFADKYSGISDEVLNKAAEYGKGVHESIELYDSLGIGEDEDAVKSYIKLCQKEGLTRLDNEYLISDNDYVASSIDVVFDDCSLADIKTTSHLDEEYVSWQLSIYAYLFEKQNPDLQANRLLAIWIPKARYGKPKVVEVSRKPVSEVIRLIEADKAGQQYVPSVASSTEITIANDVVQEVIRIERELKELKDKQTELREGLLKQMQDHNIKSFKTDGLSLTRKLATTKTSLDSKMLQEKYPEIYNECLKTSEVKESLLIKI
jgi:hypothetical protein